MHVFQRHAQPLVDLINEVFQHGMREARLIGFRGDVALVVGPFVHGEDVHLAAIHLEIVDQLRQRNIGFRLGIAQDQRDFPVVFRSFPDAREQGGDEHRVGIEHNLDVEIRVRVLFQILAADLAQALAHLAVLEGNIVAGLEGKIGRGIKNNVFHRTRTPF